MPTIKGVRERARAEITAEITAEARRQLAVEGAAGLSLRAVARELGMVSSGDLPLRRQPRRAADVADHRGLRRARRRGRGGGRSGVGEPAAGGPVRRGRGGRAPWAVANPHEYALVYGSPVPGYAAPADTIGPASRVTLGARRHRRRRPPGRLARAAAGGPVGDRPATPCEPTSTGPAPALDVDLPDDVLVARAGGVDPAVRPRQLRAVRPDPQRRSSAHDELLDATAATMAHRRSACPGCLSAVGRSDGGEGAVDQLGGEVGDVEGGAACGRRRPKPDADELAARRRRPGGARRAAGGRRRTRPGRPPPRASSAAALTAPAGIEGGEDGAGAEEVLDGRPHRARRPGRSPLATTAIGPPAASSRARRAVAVALRKQPARTSAAPWSRARRRERGAVR